MGSNTYRLNVELIEKRWGILGEITYAFLPVFRDVFISAGIVMPTLRFCLSTGIFSSIFEFLKNLYSLSLSLSLSLNSLTLSLFKSKIIQIWIFEWESYTVNDHFKKINIIATLSLCHFLSIMCIFSLYITYIHKKNASRKPKHTNEWFVGGMLAIYNLMLSIE